MKKVLLASTALILTAGFASAQGIELSGEANAGLKYNSDADIIGDDTLTMNNEIYMTIAGSGTADTGLEFGAFLTLDHTGGLDDQEVFISGSWGTLTVGAIDPATDGFGIADPGYDGIGIDDVAEQFKNADASADVHYAYSMSGLTFTAAYGFEGGTGVEDSISAAVEYEAGAFSVGVGYAEATTSTVSVVAGYSQGPISVNGIYSDWSVGGQGYGVDVSFNTGAATITAVYANASGTAADPTNDGVGDAYGIGVSIPLGGGLTVAGGVGIIETDATRDGGNDGSRTVADLGLKMVF